MVCVHISQLSSLFKKLVVSRKVVFLFHRFMGHQNGSNIFFHYIIYLKIYLHPERKFMYPVKQLIKKLSSTRNKLGVNVKKKENGWNMLRARWEFNLIKGRIVIIWFDPAFERWACHLHGTIIWSESGNLKWWISRSMLDLLFFLISRLT